LLLNAEVKNVSSSSVTLKRYITAMATFVNGDEQEQAKAGPRDFVGRVDVEPNTPIGPGETRQIRLRMSSKIFSGERIVPVNAPQQFVAGLLRFDKADGGQQMVLLRSNIIPARYGTVAIGN
jgi:methane/ammonia monooxygenase subunit B